MNQEPIMILNILYKKVYLVPDCIFVSGFSLEVADGTIKEESKECAGQTKQSGGLFVFRRSFEGEEDDTNGKKESKYECFGCNFVFFGSDHKVEDEDSKKFGGPKNDVKDVVDVHG